MRLTIAYSKIMKRNLVLIKNDTYQRETVSERPIRTPLKTWRKNCPLQWKLTKTKAIVEFFVLCNKWSGPDPVILQLFKMIWKYHYTYTPCTHSHTPPPPHTQNLRFLLKLSLAFCTKIMCTIIYWMGIADLLSKYSTLNSLDEFS